MKRGRLFVILICVCFMTLLAMSLATAAEPKGKPIKIGGTLPITGPVADNAKWVKRGYEYWVEKINKAGGLLGRPVELVIYDDEGKPDKGVMLLEKAITVDKADLLIGGYPGNTCAAQMPVAEKYGMIYISQGGHMASFSQGFQYSFSATPMMGEWLSAAFFMFLDSLPAKDRPKSVAFIRLNNPIGRSGIIPERKWAEKLGMKIVLEESYDPPLTSADAIISKAKERGAELLYCTQFFPDAVLTVRSAKSLGYNPKFFQQSIAATSPAWTKTLGADANYVFQAVIMVNSLPYPGIKELNKLAKEKWGERDAPEYFLFGYSWIETLQKGVEGAKTLKQDDIKNFLRKNEITIISGKYRFDEKGLPLPYSYVMQVINGKAEVIYPIATTAKPIYPKPPWGK
ncbi:MAG: amino acid ABC transporter substrate-binding protein [Proteobacteria bacterium]|nr:amino acid ABC transporter substrate-binding protein [Pseudomonadota bacterium]